MSLKDEQKIYSFCFTLASETSHATGLQSGQVMTGVMATGPTGRLDWIE